MTQTQDEKSHTLLVFGGLSILFVAITIGVLIVLGAISNISQSPAGSNAPYPIGNRALPKASTAADLLPQKVGSFARGTIKGTIDGYTSSYSGSNGKISIRGTRDVSVAAAQQRVANLYSQSPNYSDPMFYQGNDASGYQFAWSHSNWFFDVTANSKAALDEFMKAFPY